MFCVFGIKLSQNCFNSDMNGNSNSYPKILEIGKSIDKSNHM